MASQQKICTPLGMAIIMLAAVKKLSASTGMPMVNMWCTQRPKLAMPMEIMESTTAV